MDVELVMGHAVNLTFRDYHNISPFILIRSADLDQKLFSETMASNFSFTPLLIRKEQNVGH